MYYKTKQNRCTSEGSSKMCAFSSKQRFTQGWHHLCMQQSVHRVRYLSLHADSCNWNLHQEHHHRYSNHIQIQHFGRHNVQEFNRRSLWQHGSSARANQRSSPCSVDETCPTRAVRGNKKAAMPCETAPTSKQQAFKVSVDATYCHLLPHAIKCRARALKHTQKISKPLGSAKHLNSNLWLGCFWIFHLDLPVVHTVRPASARPSNSG